MKQSQREAMSNCVWNSAAEQRREENVASFTFVHACRLVEEAEPDHPRSGPPRPPVASQQSHFPRPDHFSFSVCFSFLTYSQDLELCLDDLVGT